VLHNGRLFVQIDNQEQSFVVALDAKSGAELWRADRDEPSQYSSPIVWKNRLRDELIVGGQFYRSYDPGTGKLLWTLDMQKGRSSATPLATRDRLYIGTEFRNRGGSDDGGGFLFAVQPGGEGQLASSPEGQTKSSILWQIERSGIQMASPALCDGHLYLLERRSGTLHCINAETGRTAYRKRIGGARAFWASPWTCDGKVYCLDSNGTTHVLAGGPEFKVLGRNPLNEQSWSTPAVADGKLFLRTMGYLYCIGRSTSKAMN
jgi:outer membrane protein assembly factor BamB